MKQFNNVAMKKGFTLIELLVAITVIAVLSAVGIATFTSAQKKSRDAKRKADVEAIRSALELYKADIGHYPYRCGWVSYTGYSYPMLKQLLEPTYMTAVPTDPLANGSHAVSGGAGYFGYMYSSNSCGTSGTSYALWAQLENPSPADLATLNQGLINTYNTGYGMNYKVTNP